MSDDYTIAVNIEGVTEETTIKDIVKFEMIHKNCGGGKVTAAWTADALGVFCDRCRIGRVLPDNEGLRKSLVKLIFKGKRVKRASEYSHGGRPMGERLTLIPVGKKG